MKPDVVWDMGGILYRYFTELMVDVGRDRGWPLERIPLGPTGVVPDPDYERMLEGEIDEPEYLEIIAERLGHHGIRFDPPRDLDWTGQERSDTWLAIRDIRRAGYRQALLTNDASRWLGAKWWETWEPAGWFEAMIDVTTVGSRKPAPEPYIACARALDTDPRDCLFIDDMPVNCRGAEAVGMSSLLFDVVAPAESLNRLRTTLGLA